MISTILFSAQFGGRDASKSVLPEFWALKRAAHGIRIDGFPVSELSFILRVDGEVTVYEPSGSKHIDVDRNGEYISVDIGVRLADRARLQSGSKPNPISEALLASVDLLRNSKKRKLREIDLDALLVAVQLLCERYEQEIEKSKSAPSA